MRIAASAVQQQDRVIDMAGCVAMGRAQGEIVQLERGQGFAGSKAEVGKNRGAVHGMPLAGGGWDRGRGWGRGWVSLGDCEIPKEAWPQSRIVLRTVAFFDSEGAWSRGSLWAGARVQDGSSSGEAGPDGVGSGERAEFERGFRSLSDLHGLESFAYSMPNRPAIPRMPLLKRFRRGHPERGTPHQLLSAHAIACFVHAGGFVLRRPAKSSQAAVLKSE